VALGRAIIRRPRVFLMDEPLSNLDARLRIETRAELKRLHQELKITTVYVTHDQAEAMSLSDRIAVLNEGLVQQVGAPREVYAKPSNMFVGGFIGSPPMNFIRCAMRNAQPLEVDCLGLRIRPHIEQAPGGELILGIRPEDVQVTSERPAAGLDVTVSVTEPAGSFTWVDVARDGVKIRGMAKPENDLEPGQAASLNFSNDKVIFFDPTTGRRL
jgi:multiple sugar transport system ATP-binding protein